MVCVRVCVCLCVPALPLLAVLFFYFCVHPKLTSLTHPASVVASVASKILTSQARPPLAYCVFTRIDAWEVGGSAFDHMKRGLVSLRHVITDVLFGFTI